MYVLGLTSFKLIDIPILKKNTDTINYIFKNPLQVNHLIHRVWMRFNAWFNSTTMQILHSGKELAVKLDHNVQFLRIFCLFFITTFLIQVPWLYEQVKLLTTAGLCTFGRRLEVWLEISESKYRLLHSNNLHFPTQQK